MDITSKMRPAFAALEGGLFTQVTKADVVDPTAAGGKSVELLGWADPFFPDPSLPEHVKEATVQALLEGTSVHYTAPIGNLRLKTLIAQKLKRQNGMTVDPARNIVITPGSDAGLLFAMTPFLCPGDEVLVPDPSYPSNFLNPALLGGVAVKVPLHRDRGWQLEVEEFEKRLTPRTKMVLLSHPNNPTTTVFRKENLLSLCDFIIRNDLVLVCDQAFEDAVFDGLEFLSPASVPGMFERTVTVFSTSKGMGLSGYRVAYLVADDRVMDKLYACCVNVVGTTNTAAQCGAIAAFENPGFVQEYNEIFDRRRKRVREMLNAVPGVEMDLPEATFLSWVNISRLGSSAQVVAYLLREAAVAVNAGSDYGEQGEGYIRIVHGCYREDERLYESIGRICKALRHLADERGIRE